ncbi:MAG: HAD-IIA family hydrolase [Chloroflexales bacterium]|nr:HAD-IIA family hydrolase [Chloroflexales bacterium]
MNYDGYIFDLDGTLYMGDALLPGARDLLHDLRERSKRVLFLSNNPTRTRQQYAEKLTKLGIAADANEVLNSSAVLVRRLSEIAPGAMLFVVGEAPLIGELEEAGFTLSEEPGAIEWVVASFDRTFSYHKLQVAFDAVRAGARLIATNADRYCPVPGGGQPDAAAVIAAIEACTGAQCQEVAGKPSALMARAALDQLGLPAQRCLMTGDRLETDILMGQRAGIDTAFVLTGASTRADLATLERQPTYVLEGVGELLHMLRQ